MKKKELTSRLSVVMSAVLMSTMLFGCGASSDSASSDTTEETTTDTTTDTSSTDSSEDESADSADDSASSSDITSFDDIGTDKVKLIALGNSDVPVGQYSEEILTNLGIWDSIQDKISYGTNVKEVLSQVEAGSVDCGIVYATDAATATGISVVCEAPEGSIKTPVVYPAAILKNTKYKDAATAFLNYLETDDAKAEFEKVGFNYYYDGEAGDTSYSGDAVTLNIFAAASLTESLNAIAEKFKEINPDITLTFNFDSSGTLQTQIESGAEADVFISAAQKQMTALSDEGYIDDDTKVDLLENKVVLIVPEK